MDVKAVVKNYRRVIKLLAFAILLVVLSLAGWHCSTVSESDLTTTVHAQQQDAMLDRRISQIEQRFYYRETRINRLESDTRFSSGSASSSAASQMQISQMQTEIETMRTEIESLRSRVGDVECGLLKIDERTLSPTARQRRRSAQGPNEPCR